MSEFLYIKKSVQKIALMQIALMLPAPVIAQDRINVVTNQYYPMNYTQSGDYDDEVIGFATELVRAVLDKADQKYVIKMQPWARVIQDATRLNNVMVYSIVRTKEREDSFYWIGEIWPLHFYLYGLKSKVDTLPRTLEGAKHLRISVGRGAVATKYLRSLGFTKLIEVKDSNNSWKMLTRNRIDLFPASSFYINMRAERLNLNKHDLIAAVDLKGVSAPLYIAMSIGSDPAVVQTIKAAYDAIVSSGQYQKLMAELVREDKRQN